MPPTSKKLRGHVGLSLSVGLSVYAPFSTCFYFAIMNLWKLVNKIPGEPHDIWHIDCVQGVDDLINFS